MNCREFDAIWNELLDAETAARHRRRPADAAAHDVETARERERELAARAHARDCARCRSAAVRNETLRRALQSWTRRPFAAPAPAPELVDRIVVSTRGARWRRGFRSWKVAAPTAALAAAACLVLALGLTAWKLSVVPVGPAHDPAPATATASGPVAIQPGGESGSEPERASGQPAVIPLGSALASATEATWDLARTASGPAARLGRQVLGTAAQSDGPSDPASGESSADEAREYRLSAIPSIIRGFPDSPPGADWLQDVGDGLAAGVRPLSETARQAFGFLRAPTLKKTSNPAGSPASKGA